MDSASANKLMLAFWLTSIVDAAVFWICCGQHMNHAIQAVVLESVDSGLDHMHVLYSASFFWGVGQYWARLLTSVEKTVRALLEVRPLRERPEMIRDELKINRLLLAFIFEGVHEIAAQARLEGNLKELFAVLNSCWFSAAMVHWCAGVTCCANGFETTVQRIVNVLYKTLLRAKPIIPTLSRWSKPIGSLDFWVPVIVLHMFGIHLLEAAFFVEITMDLDSGLQALEAACVEDMSDNFKAVQSKRIKRAFSTLRLPMTICQLIVMYLALAPLRYIAKCSVAVRGTPGLTGRPSGRRS